MIPALFFCARFRRAVDTDLGNAAAVTCSFATSERILGNEGGHLQHMTRLRSPSSNCDATCTIGLLIGSRDTYDEGERNVG